MALIKITPRLHGSSHPPLTQNSIFPMTVPEHRQPVIQLSEKKPFSSGGNRICYRHPDFPNRCLKVFRERGRPENRRSRKRFPANLRPLETFDENLIEQKTLQFLHHNFPEAIRRHLPTSYGIVETDLGSAHDTTLICDHDGRIAQTLEQYLWDNDLDDRVKDCLKRFKADWSQCPPSTRDLIPHNLVVRANQKGILDLFLIDGYGRTPKFYQPKKTLFKASLLRRRMENLDRRIEKVLEKNPNSDGLNLPQTQLIRD